MDLVLANIHQHDAVVVVDGQTFDYIKEIYSEEKEYMKTLLQRIKIFARSSPT